MAQDPSTIVRSSTQLWSENVAMVEAQSALDCAAPGEAGIAALVNAQEPVVYEFSNRRKFRDNPIKYR